MTDQELQQAIDTAMAMAMSTAGGYQHDKFRELAQEHLQTLFKIQVTRAAMLHAPGVRPGAIVLCQESRPGCEKILGGLCDCGVKS